MVAALLENKAGLSRSPWRAEQLMRDFRTRFTSRGFRFAAKDADTFRRLIDERYAADYGRQPVSERRAAAAVEDSERLCDKIEEVMGNG